MKNFGPALSLKERDLYWIVGEDTNKVFSSAKAKYVSAGDADYEKWLADGGRVTRILSEQELVDALAVGMPHFVPEIPLGLLAYARRKRLEKDKDGWVYEGKPIVPSVGDQLLTVLAFAGGAGTIPWVFADGSVVDEQAVPPLAGALLKRLAAISAVHVKLVKGIISSPPTITSAKQIDDAYAAVK
jgi:hypothetical protein